MGISPAQISYRPGLTPATPVSPGLALGDGGASECLATKPDSAIRPAPNHALSGDVDRNAPTPLPLPGKRVGAPFRARCIPLFANVVHCMGRSPGSVCVSVPIPGFFHRCPLGHTQLPTTSSFFKRFAADGVISAAHQLPGTSYRD